MAVILALPRLFDAVKARWLSESVAISSYFGWREVAKQHDGSRCVWVPGEPSGKIGAVLAPKYPGVRLDGRRIANIAEAFHVYVTGYDRSKPEDERLQYIAARLALDELIRAIYLEAHGTFALSSTEWVTGKKEFRAGATILVVGTIQATQPDSPLEKVATDAVYTGPIEILDVSETLTAPES